MTEKLSKIKTNNNESDVLEAIHEDVLITDAEGVIIQVSKSFEQQYGITEKDALGKTVYEMEKAGVFSPSVTAMVLEKGEAVTIKQKYRKGRDIVVTAIPIKDEQGKIIKVISFSRDITEFLHLQEQYLDLESKFERYAQEVKNLREENLKIDGIVYQSNAMEKIIATAVKVAPFDANILITGPSGAGKTFMSKFIHSKSDRKEGPFIEINCGAIPDALLESELFGYEKGAFTGASKEGKIGLIELAEGGTLFLDEISEISTALQVKLLKVLQDKKITRVGGIEEKKVNFRLITATNANIKTIVESKAMREDLLYRINVIAFDIPPLSERKEDITAMTVYFINKFNEKHNRNVKFSPDIFRHFLRYDWPGNIRELENIIERIILTAENDMADLQDTSLFISEYEKTDVIANDAYFEGKSLEEILECVEKATVIKAYEKYKTTVGVAKSLEISQPTASRKIQKYIG